VGALEDILTCDLGLCDLQHAVSPRWLLGVGSAALGSDHSGAVFVSMPKP
jgi:hypothetical protein